MYRVRGVAPLDEVDQQLAALLIANARISNRDLAQRVGLTDETVAARLRRLREDDLVTTTVLIDWRAAGFTVAGLVRLGVGGRPAREVAEKLMDLDRVHSISETIGRYDLVAILLGRDLADLRRMVIEEVRPLDGVRAVGVDVLVDVTRNGGSYATLPMRPWSVTELPSPVIELDQLDRALIEQLIINGRDSNRELARRLGVSDGTVRTRIRRLTDSGFARLANVCDPVVGGEITSAAWVFLVADELDHQAVEQRLLARTDIAFCASVVGEYDFAVLLTSPSENAMGVALARDLPAMDGVGRVDAAVVEETLLHRAHLTTWPQDR